MIRRFVSLSLVFLLLANQGLCVAHAHGGSSVTGPDGHGSRPHFHVGGHVHHHGAHHHTEHSHPHHSDSDPDSGRGDATLPPACSSPLSGHDTDAVYCGESLAIARNGNSVKVLLQKETAGGNILQAAIPVKEMRPSAASGLQPSRFVAAPCSIYLLTRTLRL